MRYGIDRPIPGGHLLLVLQKAHDFGFCVSEVRKTGISEVLVLQLFLDVALVRGVQDGNVGRRPAVLHRSGPLAADMLNRDVAHIAD